MPKNFTLFARNELESRNPVIGTAHMKRYKLVCSAIVLNQDGVNFGDRLVYFFHQTCSSRKILQVSNAIDRTPIDLWKS